MRRHKKTTAIVIASVSNIPLPPLNGVFHSGSEFDARGHGLSPENRFPTVARCEFSSACACSRRDAGFQKRVTFDPTRAAIFKFVTGRVERLLHRRRHPEIERIADEGAVKFFRRDTDDRVLNTVEVLRSADDVRIAVVSILPRSVADDCDRMRVTAASSSGLKPRPRIGLTPSASK